MTKLLKTLMLLGLVYSTACTLELPDHLEAEDAGGEDVSVPEDQNVMHRGETDGMDGTPDFVEVAPDAAQPDAEVPDVEEPDAMIPDAALPDATTPDGPPPDAAPPDAEAPDAEAPDAEEPDAEEPDAEEPDAEEPDAEEPDAEEPDAEEPDAEVPDAEVPDAEEPDAEGPDAAPVVNPYRCDDNGTENLIVSIVALGDDVLRINHSFGDGEERRASTRPGEPPVRITIDICELPAYFWVNGEFSFSHNYPVRYANPGLPHPNWPAELPESSRRNDSIRVNSPGPVNIYVPVPEEPIR